MSLIWRVSMILGLAVLMAAPAAAQNPLRGKNPFSMFGGSAAFNLGPIGARAKPLAKNERAPLGLKGGQTGLKVTEVDAGQPGSAAGLTVGDVIVGVGKANLSDKSDPVYQLAAAILPLYKRTRSGILPLRVSRGGKIILLKVKVPAKGSKWATKLMTESFNYLLKQQASDGKFPTMVGGNNGNVAVTAICGLALFAAGGTPRGGSMAKALQGAKDYLLKATGSESSFGLPGGRRPGGSQDGMGGNNPLRGMRGGGNWSQVNWALGYGAMFLAEYMKHLPDAAVRAKLVEICGKIEKNQESNGGWAHGPGGANALGYTDFAAVSAVVMAGYGAAGKVKIKTKPNVIKKGVNYMIGTASGTGGIGYSQRAGQKGMGDAGRTGAAILGFAMCNQKKNPFFGRMGGFFKRHLAEVPEGHASPIYHFGMSAMASYEVSGVSTKFMKIFEAELLMGRKPDGSFSPRPSREAASMGMSSDKTMGVCWTSGTYLLVWNLGRGKMYLYGKKRRR